MGLSPGGLEIGNSFYGFCLLRTMMYVRCFDGVKGDLRHA